VCVCVYTHTVYIYTHTIFMYIYIHTHTHTHVCVFLAGPNLPFLQLCPLLYVAKCRATALAVDPSHVAFCVAAASLAG